MTMGGFTTIKLKEVDDISIKIENQKLSELKVAKKYRFYSEDDIKLEYDSFKKGKGVFPERLFQRDKIKSYDDFKAQLLP